MKVDYINAEQTDTHARCTFMGSDANGRRRPVIELDGADLARLVEIAKEFRLHQRRLAQRHLNRVAYITASGLPE